MTPGREGKFDLYTNSPWFTLPKLNSSPPEKLPGPKRKVVFQPSYFRVYLKLPWCIYNYIQGSRSMPILSWDFLGDFCEFPSWSHCDGFTFFGRIWGFFRDLFGKTVFRMVSGYTPSFWECTVYSSFGNMCQKWTSEKGPWLIMVTDFMNQLS